MTSQWIKKAQREKQRHQVKSRWYYIFWGTATVTVFAGQMYVGGGFRRMAESLYRVLDAPIKMHICIPPDPWEDHPMLIKW